MFFDLVVINLFAELCRNMTKNNVSTTPITQPSHYNEGQIPERRYSATSTKWCIHSFIHYVVVL
jgi:hypothetical protein